MLWWFLSEESKLCVLWRVIGLISLLPPASAVEVIESEPCVCLCFRTLTVEPFDLWPWFLCLSMQNKKRTFGKRTVQWGNAGGTWTLRRFHFQCFWHTSWFQILFKLCQNAKRRLNNQCKDIWKTERNGKMVKTLLIFGFNSRTCLEVLRYLPISWGAKCLTILDHILKCTSLL